MNRFLREPISVRNAASVIVTATFIVVVGGGIAIRVDRPSRVLEHLGGHVVVPADGHDSRIRRRDAQRRCRQDRRRGRDARGDRVPRDHHGGDHLGVRDARAARAEVRSADPRTPSRKQQATRSSTQISARLERVESLLRGAHETVIRIYRHLDPERTWRGDRGPGRHPGRTHIYAEKDDSKMRGFPRYWSHGPSGEDCSSCTGRRSTCSGASEMSAYRSDPSLPRLNGRQRPREGWSAAGG